MSPKALQALKESIAKWEFNLTVDSPEKVLLGSHNCPLCVLYNYEPKIDGCVGCPIFAADSRHRFCASTPYYRVVYERINWSEATTDADKAKAKEEYKKGCQTEIDFLKALLPIEAENVQT